MKWALEIITFGICQSQRNFLSPKVESKGLAQFPLSLSLISFQSVHPLDMLSTYSTYFPFRCKLHFTTNLLLFGKRLKILKASYTQILVAILPNIPQALSLKSSFRYWYRVKYWNQYSRTEDTVQKKVSLYQYKPKTQSLRFSVKLFT